MIFAFTPLRADTNAQSTIYRRLLGETRAPREISQVLLSAHALCVCVCVCVWPACFIASGKRQGLWKTQVRDSKGIKCNSFHPLPDTQLQALRENSERCTWRWMRMYNVNVNRSAFQRCMSELMQTVVCSIKSPKNWILWVHYTYICVHIKHKEHHPKSTLKPNSSYSLMNINA